MGSANNSGFFFINGHNLYKRSFKPPVKQSYTRIFGQYYTSSSGTTINLSSYFNLSQPIGVAKGVTGSNFTIPDNWNFIIWIDSDGNITSSNVIPGQIVQFKSDIIGGNKQAVSSTCDGDDIDYLCTNCMSQIISSNGGVDGGGLDVFCGICAGHPSVAECVCPMTDDEKCACGELEFCGGTCYTSSVNINTTNPVTYCQCMSLSLSWAGVIADTNCPNADTTTGACGGPYGAVCVGFPPTINGISVTYTAGQSANNAFPPPLPAGFNQAACEELNNLGIPAYWCPDEIG